MGVCRQKVAPLLTSGRTRGSSCSCTAYLRQSKKVHEGNKQLIKLVMARGEWHAVMEAFETASRFMGRNKAWYQVNCITVQIHSSALAGNAYLHTPHCVHGLVPTGMWKRSCMCEMVRGQMGQPQSKQGTYIPDSSPTVVSTVQEGGSILWVEKGATCIAHGRKRKLGSCSHTYLSCPLLRHSVTGPARNECSTVVALVIETS